MRRPSVFTPWHRRFADERRRELKETFELYDDVARLPFPTEQERLEEVAERIGRIVPPGLGLSFVRTIAELLRAERYIFFMPDRSVDGLTLEEFAAYRNFLSKKRHYFDNRETYHRLFDEFTAAIFGGIGADLPTMLSPSPFTIPLLNALPDPKGAVQLIFDHLANQALIDRGVFDELAEQLSRNLARISGFDYDSDPKPSRIKYPRDSDLANLPEYVRNTVFEDLFETPVPLRLTHHERMNHWHVLAGSGTGKTVLIENLLLHDIHTDDPPSLVVIDPHSDLINKLLHADLGVHDRIIYINPRDTQHPVALNIFAQNPRLGSYDEAMREQITAGVIQTFDYLWSGVSGLTLSGKQQTFFRFLTRFLISLPETMGRNATVLDMLRLMDDPAPYRDAIAALPPIHRDFFERDFQSKTFAPTNEQIRYRIQAIIENPTMARLLSSPETKLDLFTEMNRGAIILVDGAKDFLKGNSAIFGQLFVNLVLQAILERAAIPAAQRKPTFLIIDEAASVFSSNIDDMLSEVRKYNCGLLLSHQYLDQANQSLRSSLHSNTGIKFAAGLSAQDARAMAQELRCAPDFILNQPRLHFAAHIRNVTPQAVSIPVEVGQLDRVPRLSGDAFDTFIEKNRARVSYRPDTPQPERPISDESDEDISDVW